MSAYAAGQPLGTGLGALAHVVEYIRTQALDAARPVQRESRTEPVEAGGVAAKPAPRPRPSPSPSPSRAARPAPAPSEQGTGPITRVRPQPRPAPRPADHSPYPPAEPPAPLQPPQPAGDGSTWLLVEQAQAGDAEAFGHLYDRYVDLVHRYIYYRLGDRSSAEDFTSETFLRAWRRIGTVTNQGRDIGAWFITIARNIVLDHVKSSRYRLEIATAEMLDADRVQDGPEGAVLDQLASAELLKCVKQLNAEQQECIVLRFLEGLSVAETASVMGKNEGAIKALQHRAVRRLATLLPDGMR
jgi:RNA polymerase sigma-70 factor (ECF subfamily)